MDFQTRKVIRAKCAAGTTSASGLPCAAGVVDHITSYETDPTTGKTREVAYYTSYPSDYNPDDTVEVGVPLYNQNGVAGSVPTEIATATPAPSGNPGVDALLSDPSVWPSSTDLINAGESLLTNAAVGAVRSVGQTLYVGGSILFQTATGVEVPTIPKIPDILQYQNSMQETFGPALVTAATLGAGAEVSATPIVSTAADGSTAATIVTDTGVVTKAATALSPVADAGTGSASVDSLFGKTFQGPDVSHLAGLQNGKVGEQVGLQTMEQETGLGFSPLQNNSNQGADGVAIDPNTKTIWVAEVKSSQNGVDAAASAQGDPEAKLQKWVDLSLSKTNPWGAQPDSNSALAKSIQQAIRDGYQVNGVEVQVGVPSPGTTGSTQISIHPWTK